MTKHFQATDSRGKTHTRSSKDRTYTHVVVVHFARRAATGTWLALEAHSRSEWAGSAALAEKNASSWRNKPETYGIEGVEVLPAVELPRRPRS